MRVITFMGLNILFWFLFPLYYISSKTMYYSKALMVHLTKIHFRGYWLSTCTAQRANSYEFFKIVVELGIKFFPGKTLNYQNILLLRKFINGKSFHQTNENFRYLKTLSFATIFIYTEVKKLHLGIVIEVRIEFKEK